MRNQLTKKEELLMEFLWMHNAPLTSVEILQYFETKGWIDTNIYRSINSLLEKKLVRVCGMEKYKNQYARKVEPALTKEEYMIQYLFDNGMKKSSIAKLVMALLRKDENDETNNDELISQLESIVKELRKEEKEK